MSEDNSVLPPERGCEMVQCPPTNNPDPSAWTVCLPNPLEKKSYCVCDWGTAIYMPCPDGLEFNPTLQICDWPA
jgi:hypothetical protein